MSVFIVGSILCSMCLLHVNFSPHIILHSPLSHPPLKPGEARPRRTSNPHWCPSCAGRAAEAFPLRHVTNHITKATSHIHKKRKGKRNCATVYNLIASQFHLRCWEYKALVSVQLGILFVLKCGSSQHD